MDQHMDDSLHDKFIPMTSITSGIGQAVLPDVYYLPIQIVNIIFVENNNNWVLIDAGMPQSADIILSKAQERYHTKPDAIILTHGHFDHIGAIVDLVEEWNVPVYAHELELPFLTGKLAYPEPDPTVEGGFLAKISSIYPNEPIDLGSHVQALPSDHTVPFLPDWKWIHTPGHTPGHISLFREKDRTMVAGDAFITVKQDSFFKVLSQKQEINGPPRYLTTDWQAAWTSVQKLAALKPETSICGHGIPMTGNELHEGLEKLSQQFETIAIPDHGKFVDGIQ